MRQREAEIKLRGFSRDAIDVVAFVMQDYRAAVEPCTFEVMVQGHKQSACHKIGPETATKQLIQGTICLDVTSTEQLHIKFSLRFITPGSRQKSISFNGQESSKFIYPKTYIYPIKIFWFLWREDAFFQMT